MGQRDPRIDALKGIAISLVVWGHAIYVVHPGDRTVTVAAIYSVHMPLFAFLSGIVISRLDDPPGFVKRRARQLMLPYTAWVVLASVLAAPDSGLSLKTSYLALIWPERGLWFLYTLFMCCVLLAALTKASRRVWLWLVVLLPLLQVLPVGSNIFGLTQFGGLFPFFAAGYWLRRSDAKMPDARIGLGVLAVVLWAAITWLNAPTGDVQAAAWYLWLRDWMHSAGLKGSFVPLIYLNLIWAITGVAALYLLSPLLKGKVERVLAVLGRHSLGVYAFHMFTLPPLFRAGIHSSVALTFVSLAMCVGATVVLRRVPYASQALLGVVPPVKLASATGREEDVTVA